VIIELSEDAQRQYIDAESTFSAWEAARAECAEVRGGMYWRQQKGFTYLVRTQPDNSQKSLGARSAATAQLFSEFIARKQAASERLASLTVMLERHRRMNRALRVGGASDALVALLNRLAKQDLSRSRVVTGPCALLAYEAQAGVRIKDRALLALADIGPEIDTDELLLAEACRTGDRMESMIVSSTGRMARMVAIPPAVFIDCRRSMAARPDRGPAAAARDLRLAEIATTLVSEYLPHWSVADQGGYAENHINGR
jgi:hypothetical protein